jgi:hypothetical protein
MAGMAIVPQPLLYEGSSHGVRSKLSLRFFEIEKTLSVKLANQGVFGRHIRAGDVARRLEGGVSPHDIGLLFFFFQNSVEKLRFGIVLPQRI